MKKAFLLLFLIINLFYITNYLFEYADPFNILGFFWLIVFVLSVVLSITVLFSFKRISNLSLLLSLGVLVSGISSLGVYGFYFLLAT
ncbi:hypothetical protein SRCM101294_00807 [Bacillus amyloliquefaciens]|nr:hypothetical protein SRCM101294_00807 [Bacillus amyloliquefaciens]